MSDLAAWLSAVKCGALLGSLGAEYGVDTVDELLDLDPDDIDALCALVKKSPSKQFRRALDARALDATLPGTDTKPETGPHLGGIGKPQEKRSFNAVAARKALEAMATPGECAFGNTATFAASPASGDCPATVMLEPGPEPEPKLEPEPELDPEAKWIAEAPVPASLSPVPKTPGLLEFSAVTGPVSELLALSPEDFKELIQEAQRKGFEIGVLGRNKIHTELEAARSKLAAEEAKEAAEARAAAAEQAALRETARQQEEEAAAAALQQAAEEAAIRESAMMAVVAAEAESLGLAVGTAVYATSTDGPVVAEILRCLQFTALSGFMFDITINHASARDVWLQF